MNETNWAYRGANSNVTDSDISALAKAKKRESELEKNGYRWIVINNRLKAFVECDENGEPTELGREQIRRQRELAGMAV